MHSVGGTAPSQLSLPGQLCGLQYRAARAPLPGLPTLSFQPQGCQVKDASSLHICLQAGRCCVAQHHPAHVLSSLHMGRAAKQGIAWGAAVILPLWAAGAPLLLFQREIEKIPRGQCSLSQLSWWGNSENPRKRRWSPSPHLELAAQHSRHQPPPCEAAASVTLFCPYSL